MPLKVVRHSKSSNLYLRGTVRGIQVYETTGTDREELAEEIRIKREVELLYQVILNKTHAGDSQTGWDVIHQGDHSDEVRDGSSGSAPHGL